jgi:hypothetical protein
VDRRVVSVLEVVLLMMANALGRCVAVSGVE